MLRSSDGFSALAAALVKVQAEIDGPEISRIATTRTGLAGEGAPRSASLAHRLDTVRKMLGKHELATVQTTSIDETGGMVNLTTTLVHSSGEWVASDWPVGPAAASANPQRMGAALTYARWCALLTVVGIASEDDLDAQTSDAPGLVLSIGTDPAPKPISNLGGASSLERPAAGTMKAPRASPLPLPSQESARLREGMLAEIQALKASDAAAWAQNMQANKNRLSAECARLLDAAFGARFPELCNVEVKSGVASGPPAEQPKLFVVGEADLSSDLGGGDQRRLAITKTVRHRNKEHLRFVQTQPCLVCARQPSDAHHLRFAQPQALGRKVSDELGSRSAGSTTARSTDQEASFNGGAIANLRRSRALPNCGGGHSPLRERIEVLRIVGPRLRTRVGPLESFHNALRILFED